MPILYINCNARLKKLLTGQSSGQIRPYIIPVDPKKKLENQVFLSNKVREQGYTPYIEVKFVSQYSSREKRIEVLGIKKNCCTLYQFTTRTSFDQDVIELNRLIKEIEKIGYPFEFSSEIVLLGDDVNINTVNTTIVELGLNIKARFLQ